MLPYLSIALVFRWAFNQIPIEGNNGVKYLMLLQCMCGLDNILIKTFTTYAQRDKTFYNSSLKFALNTCTQILFVRSENVAFFS